MLCLKKPNDFQNYADLYSRTQGGSETANDFGRGIQQLVHRAYAEIPVEHQDTLMREHFVNGLRPKLKRIVLISDPKTFSQALALEKKAEINEQITNGSAPWVRPNAPYPNNAVATSPVAAVTGEQKLNERLDRLESVVEKLALTLTENSVPRHGFEERSRAERRHDRKRNLRSCDGRPICKFCQRVGHVEARCYKKNQQN